MSLPFPRTCLALALLALAHPASAQNEKLTKAEIAKRAKAATAFVHCPNVGSGTAFCIHPSGLFVTNEHVIRGAKEEVILVLHPAQDTERTFKARVVRTDKDVDLALLRVDGANDLPSLALGSIKEVAELTDVVACGFPLGFLLSTDKKRYPAISVNAGSVSSLRYKDKELQFLQIDVAVTFGNSGGPVLDSYGKVIGVVVSGISGGGKGINKALPVSRLERFLKAPDVALVPLELPRESLRKPLEFKARLVSFVPDAPEPGLKLILHADDEEPREFAMKKKSGTWVAVATPVGKPATPRVELSARIGSGTVTGTTEDVVVKIGGKPMRLSHLRRIELKPKPGVLLADGKTTVEGEVAGLGLVEFDVGGQKVKLDLTKVTQVTVQAAPEVVSVLVSLVAFVDGKEVARTETRLPVRETLTTPANPKKIAITPPTLDESKVMKRLPESFTTYVVGGGGRYLIFHLPKLKKLAVFDVNEARVTKYVPLTEDDVTFTAGLDSLVIGLKKSGKLERWSLTTFELEKSSLPPFREDVKTVMMGHGSNGPLIVNDHFLDLTTFKPLAITTPDGGLGGARTVSGDGTVFARWGGHAATFVLEGSELRRHDETGLGHLLPGPDGQTVFTAKGIVSRTLKRGEPDDATYGYCVPAVRGDFFLSITPAPPGGKGGGFVVYLRGLKHAIVKLDNADHGLHLDGAGGDTYVMWRRVIFVPDAKLIVLLPESNDRLVLYKFDADAALEQSGFDYLLISSQPPREVKAGTTLTYQVKVKSKQGGVKYSLGSGPKGMEVSAEGLVTWSAPIDVPAGNQEVILTVRDKSGQEIFHTFTIRVVR